MSSIKALTLIHHSTMLTIQRARTCSNAVRISQLLPTYTSAIQSPVRCQGSQSASSIKYCRRIYRSSHSAGRYARSDRHRPYSSVSSTELPEVTSWIDGKASLQSTGGSGVHRHAKTGQPACNVIYADNRETSRAIERSMEAFAEWKTVSGWERKALLVKILQNRFDEFRGALLADVSMSDILIGADQKSSANLVDGAATTAISIAGSIPSTLDGHIALSTREPFGPVLSIPAFNFPMTLALRSIVYPLACGNTVIMKASTYVPQLHSLLGTLFKEAGFPDGVVQVLHFSEDDVAERVGAMIAHPDIRMVNFTGSTKLGRVLAGQCGTHLKPSVMELGGKSAAIVLPCADLKLAANNIIFGAMLNSGQICMSTERVLAHSDIAVPLEAELRACMDQISRKRFEIVRPGSVKDVQGIIAEAVKQGSTRHGRAHEENSTALPAQLIVNPAESSRLWAEETFSPTVTLSSFDSTDAILSALHSVPTGLSTAVFGSLGPALEVAKRVDSGMVRINSMTVHDEHTLPFGGVRDSGWGRFNGNGAGSGGAVESFTWVKNISLGNGGTLPLGALGPDE